MTSISKSLEEMYKEIYADGTISSSEYQKLRDDADRRINEITDDPDEFKQHSNITAFQKSMDVTMQLLQLTVLDAKKMKLSDTGEAKVKDALVAQVEYLHAGCKLFLKYL